MYLYRLKVKGFRKILDAEVFCNQSTFLVGPNNSSKTTFLKAIEVLLSSSPRIAISDYYALMDEDSASLITTIADEIIIEGEFRDVAVDYKTKRGFKGRIFDYDINETEETGCKFTLRKVFTQKGSKFEILSTKRKFKEIKKWQEVIDLEIARSEIEEVLEKEIDLNKKPAAGELKKIDHFDELYDYENGEEEWIENPGGLVTVFNKNLPKFLLIPAMHSLDHFTSKGVLHEILKSIFDDVKENSVNYKKASEFLNKLVDELDPTDNTKEYGKLLNELNDGFEGVFPGASLSIRVDLSDPNTAITPKYDIKAKSNILTEMDGQGTGLSRSAVFNLLKFHAEWKERKSKESGQAARKILIGFEEPEIYLHPSASRLIRDFMYELASSKVVQIVSTTHSTHMIDLSVEGIYQVINHCKIEEKEFELSDSRKVVSEVTSSYAFKHSEEFIKLQGKEKEYLKMLLVVDERFANVFFTKMAVVFEGNTEEVVLKKSISLMDKAKRRRIMSDVAFVNARGKATIISIAKYLTSLGIKFRVIHDMDAGVAGAEKFNGPISEAAGDGNVYQLENCIEDVLGYDVPVSDKPYKAYNHIEDNWTDGLGSASKEWQKVIAFLFDE